MVGHPARRELLDDRASRIERLCPESTKELLTRPSCELAHIPVAEPDPPVQVGAHRDQVDTFKDVMQALLRRAHLLDPGTQLRFKPLGLDDPASCHRTSAFRTTPDGSAVGTNPRKRPPPPSASSTVLPQIGIRHGLRHVRTVIGGMHPILAHRLTRRIDDPGELRTAFPAALSGRPSVQTTGGGVPSAVAARAGSHSQRAQACWNAERATSTAAACGSRLAQTSSQSSTYSPKAASQRAASGVR